MRSSSVRAAAICLLVFGAHATAWADPPHPVSREADAAVARASRAGQRLLMLLDQSRLSREISQISCVDQKLSQVNSFGRMLAARRLRLAQAVSRHDRREIAHERGVIRRLVQQLVRLEREGRACVFPEAGEEQRTVVTVTVDPSVPQRAVVESNGGPRRW